MKNAEIADIFAAIADLQEILGADRFRINSYRKVSRTLAELTEDVEDLAATGELEGIPGIGKSTAQKIRRCLQMGRVEQYDELRAKVPPELPGLLEVSGLGPKTVAKLWKQGGITSVAELSKALDADSERLAAIEGLGEKKLQQIREALAFKESGGGRVRLGEADELAAGLVDAISRHKAAKRVVAAGSLRRGCETVGDIDLLCEASASAGEGIIQAFAGGGNVRRVLAAGKTKGSIVLEGDVQADLRVVPAKSYGAALAYFTGSKEHNVCLRELAIRKGWKLNEYGLFDGDGKQIAGATERSLYEALGMEFIPPELREDRGELDAADQGKLPELLELADIRGDMHLHTRASDGANTIEEMISACRQRGYKYMCFCDHSRSQVQANGLDASRLAEHVKAIRAAGRKCKDILVLAGCEVDIFKDGSLDFEADVLAELDFVTASAHSALSQRRPEATRRLIKAIETPHVHCIGHPSGRLILSRAGMEIDINEIAHAAAANNVALELNAHYWRLDLRDTHVRAAIEAGAKIIINTDAHSTADLDYMKYGVTTARRGWAKASDAINTYTPAKLKSFLTRE